MYVSVTTFFSVANKSVSQSVSTEASYRTVWNIRISSSHLLRLLKQPKQLLKATKEVCSYLLHTSHPGTSGCVNDDHKPSPSTEWKSPTKRICCYDQLCLEKLLFHIILRCYTYIYHSPLNVGRIVMAFEINTKIFKNIINIVFLHCMNCFKT